MSQLKELIAQIESELFSDVPHNERVRLTSAQSRLHIYIDKFERHLGLKQDQAALDKLLKQIELYNDCSLILNYENLTDGYWTSGCKAMGALNNVIALIDNQGRRHRAVAIRICTKVVVPFKQGDRGQVREEFLYQSGLG